MQSGNGASFRTDGLSHTDSPERPEIRPGPYHVVETDKLVRLKAHPDDNPPGHWSVGPDTAQELQEWASTKGSDVMHPLTQEKKEAVVGRGVKE